jgi:lipoprotein-releasing system permease protein
MTPFTSLRPWDLHPDGFVPRMKKFVVVGIFDSGFYEYDSTLAYLSLRDCRPS